MFKKLIAPALMFLIGLQVEAATRNAYVIPPITNTISQTISSETPVFVNDYVLTCDAPAYGCTLGSVVMRFTQANNGAPRGIRIYLKVEKSTQNNSFYDVVILPQTFVGVASEAGIGKTLPPPNNIYTTGTIKISVYAGLNGTPSGVNPVLTSITTKAGYWATNDDTPQDIPMPPNVSMPTAPNALGVQSVSLTAPYRKSGAGQVAMDVAVVKQFIGKIYKLQTVNGVTTPVLVNTQYFEPRGNFSIATKDDSIRYPSEGQFYVDFSVEDITGKISMITKSTTVSVLGVFAAPTIVGGACPSNFPGTIALGTVQYTAAPTMRDGSAIVASKYKGIIWHVIVDGTTDVDVNYGMVQGAWTNGSTTKTTPSIILQPGAWRIKLCSLDTTGLEGACATTPRIFVTYVPDSFGGPGHTLCQIQ